MSLKRALERLPHDRVSETATRDLLQYFRRHPGEWVSLEDVARRFRDRGISLAEFLAVFAESLVLDAEGDPPRYRYECEPFVEIEIDRFMRHTERRDDLAKHNVAKFRERHSFGR